MPSLHNVLLLTTVYLSLSSYALPMAPDVADQIPSVVARDTTEFVGFHGTNSKTAAFWEKNGFLSKPPPPANSVLDFLGLTSTKGTSGADAELGPGLYVADEPVIALGFANNNAKVNPGTQPKVCAIFAKSSGNWRNVVQKVFIPESLVGDSSDVKRATALENARLSYITKVHAGAQASSTVKFSLLDRTSKTGQMLIPNAVTNLFSARCFDFNGHTLPAGTTGFPAFSYNSPQLRSEWKITAENEATAKTLHVA